MKKPDDLYRSTGKRKGIVKALLIRQVAVFLLLAAGSSSSETFTWQTATNISPEKNLAQIEDAIHYIRTQPQTIPIAVVKFASPVEYMTRLRRFRIDHPSVESSGESGGAKRASPNGSVEQLVHNWSDYICVKWGIPKVYKAQRVAKGLLNCPECKGLGSTTEYVSKTENLKCPDCLGVGTKVVNRLGGSIAGKAAHRIRCTRCGGDGKIISTHKQPIKRKCLHCAGTGKSQEESTQEMLFVLLPTYNSANRRDGITK